jgi:hypothetical protein
MRSEFGFIHTLIRDFENYPDSARPVRVGLEIREVQNPGQSIRPANLLELAYFSIKHPFFFQLHGPVRAFDSCIERMAKEIAVPFRVPFADCDEQGKIKLSLSRFDRRPRQKYSLEVVEEMPLHI